MNVVRVPNSEAVDIRSRRYEFSDTYAGSTPLDVRVIVRLKGYKFASALATIASGTGMSVPFTMTADPAVNLP